MQYAMGSHATPAKSAESGLLEVAIGLDDLAQLIFRGAIAAIGVGMMAFYQFLEPRLDVGAGGTVLQSERVQRLALGVAYGAPLGLGPRLRGAGTWAAELPQEIERIVGADALDKRPASLSLGAALAADHPDPPGRKMPGERILLKTRHRIVAHAGEEIVGLVIFADMIEAEPPIFALAVASLRRPVGRRLGAIRPIAARLIGVQPAIL